MKPQDIRDVPDQALNPPEQRWFDHDVLWCRDCQDWVAPEADGSCPLCTREDLADAPSPFEPDGFLED